MADPKPWMIYGANGYTGVLCAERALEQGATPVLAGRRRDPVEALGRRLGLPTRVFSLDDVAALDDALNDVSTVLHCAGPFSMTAAPMMEACLRTGTHYLDITGERAVFEALFTNDARAKTAEITMVSGVGVDVIPTDCLAGLLQAEFPRGTTLALALAGLGSPSGGTLKTVVEGMGMGGWVREGGALKQVPMGWRSRQVTLPNGPRTLVTAPLGDLVTAYHSTGIPNITTWFAVPRPAAPLLKASNLVAPLMRRPAVVKAAQRVIGRFVDGPDDTTREVSFIDVWGELRDDAGGSVEGALTLPEGYTFTAIAAVECALRTSRGEIATGALAPASAFGARFVLELPGVTFHGVTKGR